MLLGDLSRYWPDLSYKILIINIKFSILKLYQTTIIILTTTVVAYLMLQGTNIKRMAYNEDVYKVTVDNHTYLLNKPKQKWKLPDVLEEISGLSYFAKNQLACVQDEKGILFIYDLQEQKILNEYKFGKKGDYEGVEVVDGVAYVLKSNGHIYAFRPGEDEVMKIETGLSAKNDAEGLGYLREKNALLVACKEKPGLEDEKLSKARAIYMVPLDPEQPTTRILIDNKSYNKAIAKKGLNEKAHKPFKPSGIAVHPDSGLLFVIASVGKLLLIIRQDGSIVDAVPLDPEIFKQPEGIAFSPDGTLYISSEGRGGKGYILQF